MKIQELAHDIATLYNNLLEEDIDGFTALMLTQYFITAKVQLDMGPPESVPDVIQVTNWPDNTGEPE